MFQMLCASVLAACFGVAALPAAALADAASPAIFRMSQPERPDETVRLQGSGVFAPPLPFSFAAAASAILTVTGRVRGGQSASARRECLAGTLPRVGGYGAWQALMMKPPDFSSSSSSRMPLAWASSSNWRKDRNP